MDIKKYFNEKNITHSDRVQFLNEKKTRYYVNASKSYGIKFSIKKILFILDDTVFGSGEYGCVIGTTGIAFNKMFQKATYVSFEKIKKISVYNKNVIINNGDYTYTFNVMNESDIEIVFNSIQEWLELRDNFKIDHMEYIEKVYTIDDYFKLIIIPEIKKAIEEKVENYEVTAEVTSDAIEDIEKLKNTVNNKETTFNEANYIDNLYEIFTSFEKTFKRSSIDFNEELLEVKTYDRDFGKFIKPLMRNIVKEFKENLDKTERINTINEYV